MAYSVFAVVYFIHNVTYIYYAIISRVKCVVRSKLLMSAVLLLCSSPLECGGGGVFFSVHLFLCTAAKTL